MSLPRLTIILPTDAKLEESEKIGLFSRWKFYFSEVSKHFDIDLYSCDIIDYSDGLKVSHNPLPFSLKFIPFGNQLFYNLYLLFKACYMTKVIRVFGVGYFVLPLMNKVFSKFLVVSHHYDYATTTKKDFGGIKGYTAQLREFSSLTSAKTVICTTEELLNKVRQTYRKKSYLVPNFVDTQTFVPLGKTNLILYAGRIFWHKGIDYLLEAFAQIEKSHDVVLKIAGTGDIEQFRDKAVDLHIKNIEFLGVIDNTKMPELMGKARIFILPSINREGHPKALIEAMASGCVCIATDVPGNRELINNGINGLLVKPKDSQSIADAITTVLKDTNLQTHLGKNAIESSKAFSLENTLNKEIALLKDLIKDTPTTL